MLCHKCSSVVEIYTPTWVLNTEAYICYNCGNTHQELKNNLVSKTTIFQAIDSDKIQREAIIELLSSRIHDIWSNWYIYQRDNSTRENIVRWDNLSTLNYDSLTEEDKEKDRKIVKKLLIDI